MTTKKLNEREWKEYRATTTQKKAVEGALLKVKEDRLISYRYLLRSIKDWWAEVRPKDLQIKFTMVESQITNVLKGESLSADNYNVLYLYFRFGPFAVRLISGAGLTGALDDELDIFADVTLRRYPSQLEYDSLDGLVSDKWEAYRPMWRENGHGRVIRSHIQIEKKGFSYWMMERQEFEFEHVVIKETDHGVMFPFASSIVVHSVDNEGVCMKTYSFHYCDPEPLPQGRSFSRIMKGVVMGVSNRGPHFAGPIVARNLPRGPGKLGEFSYEELIEEDETLRPKLAYLQDYSLRHGLC